jgi:hypothetical protein
MSLSYLVSTAGHAQAQNDEHPHGIKTIGQLIQEGAEEFGDEKVVGFTSLDAGQWTCQRYCMSNLQRPRLLLNSLQPTKIYLLFPILWPEHLYDKG